MAQPVILRHNGDMRVPMTHLFELTHVVALLDDLVHPSVVDRALRKADIDRGFLRTAPCFLPYSIEAVVLESVARDMGEAHLGAILGNRFDYGAYRGYSTYVLGAKDLASALARGRQALPLLHPGSQLSLEREDGQLVLGFLSGLSNVVGHRHLDEAAILIMAQVCRAFLGPGWRPEWIELSSPNQASRSALGDMLDTPVRAGRGVTGFALRFRDIFVRNPTPPKANDVRTLDDLVVEMGVEPQKRMEHVVRDALRFQFAAGDISEEAVARRLAMGPRTLQRALRKEGTSFRELRARIVADRASILLVETDLGVEAIGTSLGYEEPKSFRRAFRAATGLSPSAFRASHGRAPA